MKFHVRSLDEQATVSHLRELRDAVGPDIDIMVDNYQGWDLKQSIRMAGVLAPYDPYWIEDPMSLDDLEGMRQLRDAVGVRICAGEQFRDLVSFRRLFENRSVDIAMIDLDVGISGFLKIAHLAEAFGIPVVSHLSSEVMAHCVAGVSNGLIVEYIPYAQPLFCEPMVVENGQIVLSQRPGLGLDFDEAALRALAA
jgi:L-alanine-DL-glutamate epimerase-like enolase superfamily enzyme